MEKPLTPPTTLNDKMAEITQGDLNILKDDMADLHRMLRRSDDMLDEIRSLLNTSMKPKKKLKEISKLLS